MVAHTNVAQRLTGEEGPPSLYTLLLKHCGILLHAGATASKLTIQPNILISAHDEQNWTDDCFCRCDAQRSRTCRRSLA